MLKKVKLLKKPLFPNRQWSYDFPPRKTPVPQKHRAISRQGNMAFSTPFGLTWDSPPTPTESVRTDGRTDGRSRDYYVTTQISWIDRLPNFLSNGAPLAGFARRLRYKNCTHSPLFFRAKNFHSSARPRRILFHLGQVDFPKHSSNGRSRVCHTHTINSCFLLSFEFPKHLLTSLTDLVSHKFPFLFAHKL